MRRRDLFLAGGAAPFNILKAQRTVRPSVLFLISDDQSWLHTSAGGDPVVRTPNFDRIAARGVRFTHSFCASPSCTPSRAGILTGQHIWRLKESGNLWSTLRREEYRVYPELLKSAGYRIGSMGKGWGPGDFRAGGWDHNPAGPPFKSFTEFLDQTPAGTPFCFWFGSQDPHRPYELGTGERSGMNPEHVRVPAWLPDSPEIRRDILDYYFEIQRFDRAVGDMVAALDKSGRLQNTIVAVTSDNGMPFPRAKTNLYDSGTRMPLAVMWPERIPPGRVVDDMVSHTDLAPTFLEAAGVERPPAMTGRSLLSILTSRKDGRVENGRHQVVTGRERHTRRRAGGAGYPMRAIRTYDHLYIRNFAPERWPAGDPPDYGDIDASPSMDFLIANRSSSRFQSYYEMACAKRPAEELYDLKRDPYQLTNLAARAAQEKIRNHLRSQLDRILKDTGDPRLTGGEVPWDFTPYYGGGVLSRPVEER
ncbi:MAG: sulfatase [Bryobacterales bacterium]|nr:sulfatase [Bryobacterales bacterium]